jgi:DNA-binding NarL/FixJ family response regulator
MTPVLERSVVWPSTPSTREREVLALMAQGFTVNEIAAHLYLTPATICSHKLTLFRKLGAHNGPHAVALGYELGLLGGAR